MATRTMKPIPPAPRMSEEEKKMKVMQILQQKREQFSINILCHLVEGNADEEIAFLVDKAVSLADAMIEKLYPLPKTKEEK